MTKQQYYDLLVCSALDGTFPAVNEHGLCRYRAGGDKKCAAGLLIPDSRYNPALEGRGVFSLTADGIINLPVDMSASEVGQVQTAHDNHASHNDRRPFIKAFIDEINNKDCFSNVLKVESIQ